MAELGLLEILPKLDKVPREIADELRHMIRLYREATRNNRQLERFLMKSNLLEVNDSKGKLYCLFKKYTDEVYAKHDAVFYLLDHPQDNHRSTSPTCFGLSRVPPTVFIRTDDGYGCLVKFLDNHTEVDSIKTLHTQSEEFQRIAISHIRCGNADAHKGNTLAMKDQSGIHRFTVIDNEQCLTNGYKLTKLWWPTFKEANEPFSKEMAKYVKELNVEKDIIFLKSCGFEFKPNHRDVFKIFTFFLKKATELQLTIHDIGLLASGDCKKPPKLNLFEMVNSCDRKQTGDAFVKTVQEKIQEGLKEYVKKAPGGSRGSGKSKK